MNQLFGLQHRGDKESGGTVPMLVYLSRITKEPSLCNEEIPRRILRCSQGQTLYEHEVTFSMHF